MSQYSYTCVDSAGKVRTGKSDTRSEAELEQQLREKGLWLLDAEQDKRELSNTTGLNFPNVKVSRRALIDLTVQLSTQIEAGVSHVNALENAAEETSSPILQSILWNVVHDIQAGMGLHEALARYPRVFPSQMVSVIRAGELSGNLTEALKEIRQQLEWMEQLMGDIRQATVYPAFILLAVCLFVLILFSFVVPKFVELLTKLDVPLPLVTQIVFGVSDFAKATWWIWGLTAIGLPPLVQFLRRQSRGIAYCFDSLKLKLPIFGPLNRMIALSRFSQNLAILFRSGIPIMEGVELTRGLIGNQVVSRALEHVNHSLEQGESMSRVLKQHPVFTNMVIRMVAIGENTGKLDTVLQNVADYYNETIPRKVRQIFGYMEPIMMLLLIGIVGVVAFAIFLPILSIMDNV